MMRKPRRSTVMPGLKVCPHFVRILFALRAHNFACIFQERRYFLSSYGIILSSFPSSSAPGDGPCFQGNVGGAGKG